MKKEAIWLAASLRSRLAPFHDLNPRSEEANGFATRSARVSPSSKISFRVSSRFVISFIFTIQDEIHVTIQFRFKPFHTAAEEEKIPRSNPHPPVPSRPLSLFPVFSAFRSSSKRRIAGNPSKMRSGRDGASPRVIPFLRLLALLRLPGGVW